MWRQRIVDFLVYVVVRILICTVQAMRLETGAAICPDLGLAVLRCATDSPPGGGRQPGPRLSRHVAGRAVAPDPADVGASVSAGARGGPHAAQDPRTNGAITCG